MVRDLPDSAGGILSYFTRHKTCLLYTSPSPRDA